jgi:hypothetical protein
MSCEKKYVMAIISMPIKVVDLASGDFECMQEYSSITIADCEPDILKPENGYENLGEKILDFLEKKTSEITLLDLEKSFEMVVGTEVKSGTESVVGNRQKIKNKTFRKFHSGRKYTLRNWKALGIHGNFP